MNALIMALVVWLMMKEMSFDGDYMVANITAYLIAQIHNFIWCKYWIFPVENKKNSIWKQILLFCRGLHCTVFISCLIGRRIGRE
jgi:putative flippase GtrA